MSPTDSDCPYCVLGATFLDYLADTCQVSNQKMVDVFEQERAGHAALVPFLKSHFLHSRLYDDARLKSLDRFLALIEAPVE